MSDATRQTQFVPVISRVVASGQAATKGYLAVLASDTTTQNATSPCNTAVGVYAESAVADAPVDILLLTGGIIPVKVGTGGATRGAKAIWSGSNDGLCDAPALADGDTVTSTWGIFTQTRSAGEYAGLIPAPAFVESA